MGETVTIRYDPLDLAELRVYHGDRFLCRAVCQEVAGQELSLQDLVRARRARRHELRAGLRERAAVIDQYLQVHQPPRPPDAGANAAPTPPRLKRYRNE